ncbi:hypothetical protein LAD77_00655 [Klebsiella pneumoniae]|nr:hypothetical protein [Klebsiella pneumoniae]
MMPVEFAQPVHRLHRVILPPRTKTLTKPPAISTPWKNSSATPKHLAAAAFANTSHGLMNSLEELTGGLCDNVLIIGARFSSDITART